MPKLPTGNITYLFTDIEGSTRHWEIDSDSMRSSLVRHDEIISSAVEQHDGVVVRSRGEGDSVFAVFTSPANAVAAACEAQLSLNSQNWPASTQIRVRMALNTGESELREEDYYGRVVNRCARLRAIAHGGQVLLAGVTARLTQDSLPEGVDLRSLGVHTLRDVQRPEEVYQLVHPDLPAEFPPLNSSEPQGGDMPTQTTAFVGRKHELDELNAIFGETLTGDGRLVMLAGEPGIGKTRIAQELVSLAGSRGALTLWGRCYEGEGAPPFWPWVQPLRQYIGGQDPERLRNEMGAGVSDIAEIISEIREKLPDQQQLPTLEPEQARFRLFDSITTFLRNVSPRQPVVLVLDDLHWADMPSLLLLRFLTQQLAESRILLVGTYRDIEVSPQHPLFEALAQLSREPAFRRISLKGLDSQDTGDFIESIANREVSQSLLNSIHASTEGNPFFTGEVVRLLLDMGDWDSGESPESYILRIPEGVREVIGQRLNKLSEGCNQILTTASVIGREFDFRLLGAVSGTDESELLDEIDEALEAYVIEEVPGTFEHYQFSHTLIQQTLVDRLSASRRVRLHARIAQSLEQLNGGNAESHASELAHHYAQAEPVLGTDKLVEYSLIAGKQALSSYAWEEALSHFQRGLAAKDKQPMDDEVASLLLGLGRSCVALAQFGTAREAFSHAFFYYADRGDSRNALEIAEALPPGSGLLGMVAITARAIELAPSNTAQQARLLSRHGIELALMEGNYPDAREALDESIRIAGEWDDKDLELLALANASIVDSWHLQPEESLQKSLKAIELASQAKDLNSEILARYYSALSLLQMGDPENSKKHSKTGIAVSEKLRDRQRLANAYHVGVYIARSEGNWKEARDFGIQALAVRPNHEGHLFNMAILEIELGKTKEGLGFLNQALNIINTSERMLLDWRRWGYRAVFMPLIARVTDDPEHIAIIEETSALLLSEPKATPFPVIQARVGLVLIALRNSDQDLALEQYQVLLPYRGSLVLYSFVSADHLLGQLANLMGEIDTSRDHFEDAIAFCRKAGYRPELAWTCHDYADMLVEANDVGRALSLLNEALEITTELGMGPLNKRVVALKEKVESQPIKAPEYPKHLTEREVEVLRLVAQGKTNREIAADLVLSERTVQRHISNIYGKINARNRADATAFALNELNGPA